MANRTCGQIYYAHQLEGVTPCGHTEVILVREEEGPDPGYIAAIPTTGLVDVSPTSGMTEVQWINDAKAVETLAVRYVRTPKAGLRLKEELPTNWKPGEYRAFSVRNIPYSALVSQDPTLRLPFKPPSIADIIRPVPKPAGEQVQPDLNKQLLEAVSGLTAQVEELKKKAASTKPTEEESRRPAFGALPGGGQEEELLRTADRIAAEGRGGKDRGRGAGEAGRDAAPSSESANSAGESEDKKKKKGGGKSEKKHKKSKKREKSEKRKKSRRSPSVSGSSSGSESSDGTPSGGSRRGRRARRGGASKLRAYEGKKKAARKNPMSRWRHLEKLAAKAGYTGGAAVERYIRDTAKIGKSKSTLYLASLIARCGERAAAGDAQGAAGTAAGALMYFDMLHVLGDIEVAWLVALEDDPQAALKTQNLMNTLSVPDPAQAQSRKKGTSVRPNFSQLAEAETLEAASEACKSWAGYDTLARGLQTA